MDTLKLGLIGNNIGQSSAPLLHKLAGAMHGLDASYDLMDLHDKPQHEFEEAFADCAHAGYAGINITFPFKERAARLVQIASLDVRALDAINTVRFDVSGAPKGFNTDFTGFMAAFRRRFPVHTPGEVAVIGCGGVSRAVTFGLAKLGCSAIKLYDTEAARANGLKHALNKAYPQLSVRVCGTVDEAAAGADGLVNCTPMGAYYAPGTAIPAHVIGKQHWAFDVVYTPIETEFMTTAKTRGLEVLSGYELFFYQGVDAFEIFSGQRVDEERLRAELAAVSS